VTNSRAIDECISGVDNGAEASSLALSDVHDKGSWNRRCVDPFTGKVLDLEARVGRSLEELQHGSGLAHYLRGRRDLLRM